MKKMKKLLSIMLTLAMVLAMTAITTVAETTGYTITITGPAGHTYEAYQIFTGDLSGSTLSNIKWGSGITAAGQTALGAAKDYAKTLATASDNSDEAKAAADTLSGYLTTTVAGTSTYSETDKNYTISGLAAGYYLVKDQDSSLTGDKAYTDYILQVVNDVTVEAKADTSSVEKKVYDEEKGFQDGSDYDIGDQIPYKLTATLGDTSAYDTYYVQFDDEFCEGLKYDGDAKVYVISAADAANIASVTGDVVTGNTSDATVSKIEAAIVAAGGKDVTSSFTITKTDSSDNAETTIAEGGKLYVTCNDVKAITATDSNDKAISMSEGTQIIVVYSAELTQDAILTAGNFNEVKLEYSNNPNEDTDGTKKPDETGETPTDKVGVFTYKLIVNKVGEDETTPLEGAGFTLYKADGTTAIGEEIKGEDITTFEWKGLDAGTYVIKETTTPAGYNTVDPITFTIKPTYKNDNGTVDEATRTALTVESDSTFSADKDAGTVTTNVVNNRGSVLPSTGGIGTTIFYIVGACLVIGAGVVLVARKRVER